VDGGKGGTWRADTASRLGFWEGGVVALPLVLLIQNHGGQGKDDGGVIGWGHDGCVNMAQRELG
jgi:hypothetical protein